MKPHILIVEDEPPLVELLRYNLEKEGYLVDVAEDGAAALERVRGSTPDLIILDWMLPELSGIEVCRQLRADPDTKEVPVIMLTAPWRGGRSFERPSQRRRRLCRQTVLAGRAPCPGARSPEALDSQCA